MGQKGKGNPPRVNPKKFTGKSGQCFEELGAYLACIAVSRARGWSTLCGAGLRLMLVMGGSMEPTWGSELQTTGSNVGVGRCACMAISLMELASQAHAVSST